MFDADTLQQVKTLAAGGGSKEDLGNLSHAELRKLRTKIDALLPQEAKISDLNLENELVTQYLNVRGLQEGVLHNDEVPLNQRAQLANSVASTLVQLTKAQEDLKRQETLKVMEVCLIEALKSLPQATKDEFFREYESLATKAGLM